MPGDLVVSDLHLRDRRGDEYFAWDQTIELARKHKVARVVATGDLLDRQTNRASAVVQLYRGIATLVDCGIGFAFVSGQHEFDEPQWAVAHPDALPLDGESFDSPLGPAYGLDFRAPGKLQEALAEVPPDRRVLFCHQAWAEWLRFEGQSQGSFAEVPGHVETVITGDLHQFRDDTFANADGRPLRCISPGATTQCNLSEPAEHFVLLVSDGGKVGKSKLKSRQFLDWGPVGTEEDLAALLNRAVPEVEAAYQRAAAADYPDFMLRPVVRVTHTCRLPETCRRVARAVGDRVFLSFRELPPEEKRQPVFVTVPAAGEAVTPLSVLDDEVDKDEDPAVHGLVARLLAANDAGAELAAWKAECLAEQGDDPPCGSEESA